MNDDLDPKDELLAVRLAAAIGSPPAELHSRLEALARADLGRERARRAPPLWVEITPHFAGLALLLLLLAGFVPSLAREVARPVAMEGDAAATLAAASLLVPLGLLLAVSILPRARRARRS